MPRHTDRCNCLQSFAAGCRRSSANRSKALAFRYCDFPSRLQARDQSNSFRTTGSLPKQIRDLDSVSDDVFGRLPCLEIDCKYFPSKQHKEIDLSQSAGPVESIHSLQRSQCGLMTLGRFMKALDALDAFKAATKRAHARKFRAGVTNLWVNRRQRPPPTTTAHNVQEILGQRQIKITRFRCRRRYLGP